MDEGLPIAYEVLEKGVPVYASDETQVGTVDHVVAAPEEDIFHGVVMRTESGPRMVLAEHVQSLHEHGVDLRISAAEAFELEPPHGSAPSFRVHEPGIKPHRWGHLLDRLTGSSGKDWTKEK
jgi:hypothetical protein